MMRTRFNRKIVPRSGSTGSFFSDEPITGDIVQGFFNGFFENEDSAAKLAAYLGDDLIELEPYDNPSAGNRMGHSGIFVRFRAERHQIDEIKAFVATLVDVRRQQLQSSRLNCRHSQRLEPTSKPIFRSIPSRQAELGQQLPPRLRRVTST